MAGSLDQDRTVWTTALSRDGIAEELTTWTIDVSEYGPEVLGWLDDDSLLLGSHDVDTSSLRLHLHDLDLTAGKSKEISTTDLGWTGAAITRVTVAGDLLPAATLDEVSVVDRGRLPEVLSLVSWTVLVGLGIGLGAPGAGATQGRHRVADRRRGYCAGMTSPSAPHDLNTAADDILQTALHSDHGRHAELLVLDGHLRQTVIALTSGSRLSDHNAPPAATIQVLRGTIEVTTDSGSDARLTQGQLGQLTKERHGVLALEDSVFLLTTVTSVEEGSHG